MSQSSNILSFSLAKEERREDIVEELRVVVTGALAVWQPVEFQHLRLDLPLLSPVQHQVSGIHRSCLRA